MTTHPVFWPSGYRDVHELARSLLRMSQGRERDERPRREGHAERASEEHHAERGERRERGERGERRGSRRQHVGRGDVYAATLLLLEEQSLHGYQIIQLIEERSGGHWRPSAGSIYPALQLLEDQGYIQGEQQESRRVFHLTDSGRAYIEDHRTELVAVL